MIIASNFKTNHTRASAKEFIDFVNDFVNKENAKHEVRIYPSFTALDSFETNSVIQVGAQNFYPIDSGSFTGEIGFSQLEEFGINTVLLGHSERRHILKESTPLIGEKFQFAVQKGLEIVFCIGEPKEVREEGLEAILTYLWKQLEGIDLKYSKLIVAYEPVWAIGTGLSASLEDIEKIHTSLREKIQAPLLYGGSVKVDNVSDVLSVPNCDGVLVGTASWEKENFVKMIEIAQKIKK